MIKRFEWEFLYYEMDGLFIENIITFQKCINLQYQIVWYHTTYVNSPENKQAIDYHFFSITYFLFEVLKIKKTKKLTSS